MEIVNKTDIRLSIRMIDKDSIVVPYLDFDWDILLYTTRNYPYYISCKNGILSEGVEIEGEYLKVYINKFDWKLAGDIYVLLITSWNNIKFADGKEDITKKPVKLSYKIIEI